MSIWIFPPDVSRSIPGGGAGRAILTDPGEEVTDYFPMVSAAELSAVTLWTPTAFESASGTYTLDLQKNGTSILSEIYSLEDLEPLTLTDLSFVGTVMVAPGDYFTVVTASNNVDLTGSGLHIMFRF